MKYGSTYLSIFLVAVQLLQYDVTSAWGKTETAVWRTSWKKTRPSIYQRVTVATDALDTGIIASDYIWWQRRTSRGGAKIGHERRAEIELSDSQAPCKTHEGKLCKKNRPTVTVTVTVVPPERVVTEGGKGFCVTRDGPKICTVTHDWTQIIGATRDRTWQWDAWFAIVQDIRDKWTLFDLEGYRSLT